VLDFIRAVLMVGRHDSLLAARGGRTEAPGLTGHVRL